MHPKAVAVAACVALCLCQPLSTTAAPRHPASPGTFHFRGAAARAHTYGPASRVSVPDGAGGLYISWADIRDGGGDIFLLRVTNTGAVAAGWPADGLPVCNAGGDQFESILIPDGSNGVLVGWLDFRNHWGTPDGYAQRVSSAGAPQWTANGVKIASGALINDATPAADGTGGLIVTWTEMGTSDLDVFAVRFTNAGALATGWTAAGTAVCTAPGDQTGAVLTPDGTGGAIIAWEDNRSGTHVYAQRMDAAGAAQWTADGIQVDAAIISSASAPFICSDGGTGAILFWNDSLSPDVVVGQRLNAAGAAQWAAGGVGVDGSGGFVGAGQCVADGGGAIVVWEESPGSVPSLRAQRVNSAGVSQWGVSATSIVSLANSYPYLGDIVPVGGGAAYFLWEDSRNAIPGDQPDIYAQLVSAVGAASWTANGTAVCVAAGLQTAPTGALDGSGGLIAAWLDQRNLDVDIYAQRYTSAGVAQFAANGKAVFSNPGMQVGEIVLQTDQGGAFVFYNEKRNGQWDIRARKFNSDGTAAGAAVIICSASGHQSLLAAIDDGAGGAIVAWTDRRSDEGDLYVQRVDLNAAPQWTANGVAVCTATGRQELARMVSDGANGAILAWQDNRNGDNNPDVYARRVNSAGVPQWAANGVAVCSNASSQNGAVIAADGGGGAIIAWSDFRSLFAPAVYAQRVNGAGATQWTADGVSIATFGLGSSVRVSDAVAAAAGEAIILISEPVYDLVTGTITSILHAQKVDGSGAAQWGATGAAVCDVSSFCSHERIVGDGANGAYVAWSDGRTNVFDIYMQRIDATGAAQWTANGNAICNASGWQYMDGITLSNTGDAYITWEDQRGAYADIYAQRVNNAGTAQWTANGVQVSGAARGQFFSGLAPWKTAAPARVFVAWTDNRAGDHRDVYLQRLDINGVAQWGADATTPTTLALATASADPDRVRLTWFSSASVAATVQRRTASEDWFTVGNVVSDGDGLIAFEDRDVIAGERYAYRLAWHDGSAEILSDAVWVTVPNGLSLAIDGFQPNPASDVLAVSFTLPSAASARLELIDVAGRRIAAREVSGLGAGRHLLRLEGVVPPAGVYFLQLTQDGRSVTTRGAIVR